MFHYIITYKHDGRTITRQFQRKKSAIKYYIELLETPPDTNISELAILENNQDITVSINKFLFN